MVGGSGTIKLSSKPNLGGLSGGKKGFAKPSFAMGKKPIMLGKREVNPVR